MRVYQLTNTLGRKKKKKGQRKRKEISQELDALIYVITDEWENCQSTYLHYDFL